MGAVIASVGSLLAEWNGDYGLYEEVLASFAELLNLKNQ